MRLFRWIRSTRSSSACQAPRGVETIFSEGFCLSGATRGPSGFGDHGDGVSWTKTNGDSCTVTFTGTGLVLRGPMSSADGKAAVSAD